MSANEKLLQLILSMDNAGLLKLAEECKRLGITPPPIRPAPPKAASMGKEGAGISYAK